MKWTDYVGKVKSMYQSFLSETIMSPYTSKHFSPADLDRIKQAVNDAERRTSGEIVPYVVDESDRYYETAWQWGSLVGIMLFSLFVIVREFTDIWLSLTFPEIAFTVVAGGIGSGLSIHFIPSLKRLFTPRDMIDRRVAQRATEAFVAEEVFNTRERTGILIFLSMLEHRVLVVGDSGINAKVKQSDWEEIAQQIVSGIRAGKPADALVEAIGMCGSLLERQGVKLRKDDRDELSDSLRMGPEGRP